MLYSGVNWRVLTRPAFISNKRKDYDSMKNKLITTFSPVLLSFVMSGAMAQLPELDSPSCLLCSSTTAAFYGASQLALLAYQSGLCVSAQLGFNGFDTHQTHDDDHFEFLEKLTDLVAFIFDTAEAGGFADKIVLTMASDFGRTPYYNAGGGKDHWPIGSALIIQQGASWGNRVVGATDEGHNALNINPATLQVDSGSNGIRLEPKHLQQAMRVLSGLEQSGVAQLFPLNAEDIDFFNPSMQT